MICCDGSACLFLKEQFHRIQIENTGFLIKEKTLFIKLLVRCTPALLSLKKTDRIALFEKFYLRLHTLAKPGEFWL
jgi:hypothetical protein